MAVRAILRWPDPRLRIVCEPAGPVDPALRAVWDDMIDTMDAMPGVGLAACQIGVTRRLAVVDASAARGQAVRMADPVCVATEGAPEPAEEASPCLPGVSVRVARPPVAVLRFRDETGAEVTRRFTGLWARSALHQLDHLEGRVILDHLGRARRDMVLRRLRKAAKAV